MNRFEMVAAKLYELARPVAVEALQDNTYVLYYEDLDDICSSKFKYSTEEKYDPSLPIGVGPIPTELQEAQAKYQLPQPTLYELQNIVLVGDNLVAITEKNKYVLEESAGATIRLVDALARSIYDGIIPLRYRKDSSRTRPTISLAGIQSNAYFHWFGDYLPKIQAAERYEEITGIYPDILVHANKPSWMSKSLEYMGIPDRRIHSWGGGHILVDTFLVPTLRNDNQSDLASSRYSPRALHWVGKRIKSNIKNLDDNAERIFITRRNASVRRMANEEEVSSVLSEFGFQPVTLDDRTFEEQVRLFTNAEAVVSPHGAGLVNLIFSNDIKVIELFGEIVPPIYYLLADGLGFPYYYLRSESTRPVEKQPLSGYGNDLVINIQDLRQLLKISLD